MFIKHLLIILICYSLLHTFLWNQGERSRGLETSICCGHRNSIMQNSHVTEWDPPLPTSFGLIVKKTIKATKCPFWIFLQHTLSFILHNKAEELQHFVISDIYSKSWLGSGLPASRISPLAKASPHLEYLLASITRKKESQKTKTLTTRRLTPCLLDGLPGVL